MMDRRSQRRPTIEAAKVPKHLNVMDGDGGREFNFAHCVTLHALRSPSSTNVDDKQTLDSLSRWPLLRRPNTMQNRA